MNIFGKHLSLSKKDVRRAEGIVYNLADSTKVLTRNDIKSWREAWQYAISPVNPNRTRLLNIYRDVDADMHLTGCVSQRTGFTTLKQFKLVDKKTGEENPDITAFFKRTWFADFVAAVLDSEFFGTTLIELGDIAEDADGMKFGSVNIVPRNHVIPEKGVIIKYENDDWHSGYDYTDSDMTPWVIQAGKNDSLGLYLKCAQHTIPKKNMAAFWDQFGEIFGMPIRIAKTTFTDEKNRTQIEKMLSDMGAAAWGLFPEGTDIELKESAKTDSYMVFDKRIDRANSEISKCILNETMTIDNGSSKSQSQTHLDVFKNVVKSDAKIVRNIINDELIPRMIMHGFPIDGYRFEWDEQVDYTPDQQVAYETMVTGLYDVDPEYFIKKYNIPIIGKKASVTVQNKKSFFD